MYEWVSEVGDILLFRDIEKKLPYVYMCVYNEYVSYNDKD